MDRRKHGRLTWAAASANRASFWAIIDREWIAGLEFLAIPQSYGRRTGGSESSPRSMGFVAGRDVGGFTGEGWRRMWIGGGGLGHWVCNT